MMNDITVYDNQQIIFQIRDAIIKQHDIDVKIDKEYQEKRNVKYDSELDSMLNDNVNYNSFTNKQK